MAFLLHVVFPHVSIPMLLGMLDGTIVLFGAFIFGVEKTSFALLVIYGITKITDSVVEGFQVSKLVFVISRHQEQISEQICFAWAGERPSFLLWELIPDRAKKL